MRMRQARINPTVSVGAALIALAPASSSVGATNFFSFTVSNVVSPEQPSATITLWAAFDPMWYAFRASELDVATNPDPGWLSDPRIEDMQAYFCDPGQVSPDGDRVADMHLIQYQFLFGQLANTDDPIKLWSATWTTDDFHPRSIPVWTESQSFSVYTSDEGGWEEFYGIDFAEGSGTITVVPGPGSALLLGVTAMWPARRPRRSG